MRKIRTITLLAVATFTLLTLFNACTKTYRNVDNATFQALVDAGAQLVDTRTPEEFSLGHIEGAILIDVTRPDFKTRALEAIDKKKPVAVYCRSGRRSRRAAAILAKEGFTVNNLDKGIIGWNEAERPTVK